MAKPTFTGGRASTRLWRSHHWATGGWFLPHQMPIAEMPNRGQQVLPFQLAQITSDLPGMGWVGDARAVVDGVEVSVTVPLASPATLDPTHAHRRSVALYSSSSPCSNFCAPRPGGCRTRHSSPDREAGEPHARAWSQSGASASMRLPENDDQQRPVIVLRATVRPVVTVPRSSRRCVRASANRA